MDLGSTSLIRHSRPVRVEVGVAPPKRKAERPPDLCVAGIVPPDFPWLSDMIPTALVRNSRFRDEAVVVEHIRLSSVEAARFLPGLSYPYPSRVRGAVQSAFASGAQVVDVVLARVRGRAPWELDAPEFKFGIDPFVADMVGTTMLYPDLGGPAPLSRRDSVPTEDKVQRMIQAIENLAPTWRERYQIAFVDALPLYGELEARLLRACLLKDISLVRFEGTSDDMVRHGWKSGAAHLAGFLASQPGNVLMPVQGLGLRLGQGRYFNPGRRGRLQYHHAPKTVETTTEDMYVRIALSGDDRGMVLSEPVLRGPVGGWTIPATRVIKVIHWRIMESSSRFVFERADTARAVAIGVQVGRALEPYAKAGVLVGSSGTGMPTVRGSVVRDPAAPGLRVDISAQVRPWAHSVNIRVSMRPGAAPQIAEV